jgi:hypothetical protein
MGSSDQFYIGLTTLAIGLAILAIHAVGSGGGAAKL